MSILRTTLFPAFARVEGVRAFSTTSLLLKKKAEQAVVKPAPLPVPPKRWPSAYLLFFKDFYRENRTKYLDPKNGKLDVAPLSREASVRWAALDPAAADKYNAESKKAQDQYRKDYAAWFDKLSEEERRAIGRQTGKRLKAPGVKKARLELKNRPGNPGKPSSSFFEFLKHVKPEIEQLPEIKSARDTQTRSIYTEITKIAGERWRKLSAAEKEEWKQKFLAAQDKYKAWLKTQE